MQYIKITENKEYVESKKRNKSDNEAFRILSELRFQEGKIIPVETNPEWVVPDEQYSIRIPQWCGLDVYEKENEIQMVHCVPSYASLSVGDMLKRILKAYDLKKYAPDIEDYIKDLYPEKHSEKPQKERKIFFRSESIQLSGVKKEELDAVKEELETVKAFYLKFQNNIFSDIKVSEDCVLLYAFDMPSLFELFVSCELFISLGAAYTICIQESKSVFENNTNENNTNKKTAYIDGEYRPDILIKDNNDSVLAVYDVKYKSGEQNKYTREDRLQILSYALLENVSRIGHIFPEKKLDGIMSLKLRDGQELQYIEMACNCKNTDAEEITDMVLNHLGELVLISDFFREETHRKRILLVSDLSRGQALLRQYEAEKGAVVRNISFMTLRQVAELLYMWECAKAGHNTLDRLLDSKEAMMLFRRVIINATGKLSYFKDPNMINIATASEMMKIADLIRLNGWGQNVPDIPRINDLKQLIEAYEQLLKSEGLLDKAALYQYVKEASIPENEVKAVLGADVYYLDEDTETYSGLEMFILEKVLRCGSDRRVRLLLAKPSIQNLQNLRGKASFYRGYGTFNEANYIANDILKERLHYGGVTVLHSSETQLPAITAALRGNHINVRIQSGYSASENPYIALARRILDWAEDDFSEKCLEAVMASPVISIVHEDGGKKRNLISGQRYFDYITEAGKRKEDGFVLGWGYGRNNDFIEHEEQYCANVIASGREMRPREQEYLSALPKELDMHKELLHIFGDGKMPYDKIGPKIICERLLDFITKYGIRSPEYAIGIEVLSRVKSAADFDAEEYALAGNIRVLRELTDKLSISDSEDNSAVSVLRTGEWCVIDRPNVYVMGLALRDMQGNNTQSPILFDDEMNNYLGDGYKPTIENETARRERNILRTLMLFKGEHITFGYSSYDTVGFCESNPSGLFRDLLKECGNNSEIKDLPEFVYGNPNSGITVSSTPSLPSEIEKEYALPPEKTDTNVVDAEKPQFEVFTDDLEDDEELYADIEAELDEYFEEEEFDEDDDYEDEEYDLIDYFEDLEADIDQDVQRPIVEHFALKKYTSNSALEELLSCPKKYAFDRLLYIPENSYREKDFGNWLNAAAKGNFFHAIADQYVEKKLKKSSQGQIDTKADEVFIRDIAEAEKDKLLKTNPVAFQGMAERETDEMVTLASSFFNRMHRRFSNSSPGGRNWRPVLTEQEFHGAEYKTSSYNDNEYDFTLNGYIDRVDYAVDYVGKRVYLRIADYKTGRRDSKEKELELGKLIQYAIYEKALMETGMTVDSSSNEVKLLELTKDAVAIQEGDSNVRNFEYKFDGFLYEFPMEADDLMIEIEPGSMERKNITRLRTILSLIESEDSYPDHRQLYDALERLTGFYPTKEAELVELHYAMSKTNRSGVVTGMDPDEAKNCKYCNYRYLCEYGKAGEN